MSAVLDCPGIESWQELFSDRLSSEQREHFERHLQSCPACQQRLDKAAECDELRSLGRQVGDPTRVAADPTLSEFLERLSAGKSLERAIPAEPVDLYFLRPADRPDLLGLLGDYEVQEVIGQGGMGVVLKAHEPALHRLVAIKVLSPALAGSATARRRFTREAQAAAAVCHDHIVTVHGVHEAAGLPYLVMQYIAGESLQERLDRTGPLEVVEIVRIGLQTVSGLAAAHAQGLIHRDIKPANLLLENGLAKVKITDFGLARMVDDVGLTQNGVVAGTPEYMAPEQARGELIDHRSDLFSLGSVLYALCTGHPPFRGSTTVAVLRQVSDQTPTPIHALNPDVPAWLETLITRLLAKDPADRFQSAAEVANLLEAYLAHLREPVTVPAPAPIEIRRPPDPRSSQATGLSSLSNCLLAFLGLVALVTLLLGFGNPPEKGDKELPTPILPGSDVDVWSLAVSADGKIVAGSAGMWDKPGEIGVWNLATQEPVQRFAEDLGVASIALSPNGKLLASGSWTGHVRVYDWSAGTQLFDFPVLGVARVAFSPDGKLLATATEDKTVQLWDVVHGKLLTDLEGDLFRFHSVTFSPDGNRVLAGGGEWKAGGISQVTIWDVASKTQVLKLTGHQGPILCISYSPDGKSIATGSADRTIRLWDADTGKHLKTLLGHFNLVESVIFLADGKTIVSGSLDRTVGFWDVERGKLTNRIAMPGGVRSVRLTPDGNTLIAGSGQKTLKLFDAASQKELATLWNGSEPRMVAMDHFPVASPTQVKKRGWLTLVGLLGLGLAFLMSLSFAIQRRRARRQLASAGPALDSLSFACSECGKNLKVRAELSGRKVKCPQCGKPTPVPEHKASEAGSAGASPSQPARRWFRGDVLATLTASGVFAVLFLVTLWLSRSPKAPHVSRLEPLAARVKAQKTDTIDARPYPSVADRDLLVLQGLSHLKTLNLDHTGITDEGLKEVAQATSLVSLSLTNVQVSNAGLAELRTLTALEDLRLDKLPITDAGLAHLSAFPQLRKLSLYQTAVTDAGVAHLKQLTFLERLSLDDTQVGDEGLRHLKQCANLKNLSVWQTRVTPAGIQELREALPRLQVNR